ncbi:MAG: hypothetical protein HY763_07175 [Planctomycetes bacterium]|nr:hypothetical protein [Planctomycetota bacterium]
MGCGVDLAQTPAARPLVASECAAGNASAKAPALVVLDWTGGRSPIYPDRDFAAIDLTSFAVSEGGTLADDAEMFHELVRLEVGKVFCDWNQVNVVLRNGEDDQEGLLADTIVHMTHEVRPDGNMDIGQGEYDPCDRQNDNAAIIFGKRIAQLGSVYSFDEWVNVFANVCAHEVAHTLGYGHIRREDRPESERSLFIELMLDRHTMTEMRRPQRFIADQTNCPDELPADTAALQGASILACGCH